MNFLPKDIENIILNYKKDYEIREKLLNEFNRVKKYYLYSYNAHHIFIVHVLDKEIIYSKNYSLYEQLPSYLFSDVNTKRIGNNTYKMDIPTEEIVSYIHSYFLKNIDKKYEYKYKCDWICLDNNLEQIDDNKLIFDLIVEFID